MENVAVRKTMPVQKAQRLMELQKLQKEIKAEVDELKTDLLNTMQDLDVLTLKTGSYTIFRAHRITPKVEDFDTLKKALEEKDIEVITEEVFAPQMDLVFRNAIEEGQKLDGLGKSEVEYVSVRLAKKEEE